jgi:hypothetical protein
MNKKSDLRLALLFLLVAPLSIFMMGCPDDATDEGPGINAAMTVTSSIGATRFYVDVDATGSEGGTDNNGESIDISQYEINWGDTNTDQNTTGTFTHNYPQDGQTYTITLTVTNDLSETDTTSESITTNDGATGNEAPLLVVNVTEDDNGIDYISLNVNFTGSSDDSAIASYTVNWDTTPANEVSDTQPLFSSGPLYEYNTGTYHIVMTIADDEGLTASDTYVLDTSRGPTDQ